MGSSTEREYCGQAHSGIRRHPEILKKLANTTYDQVENCKCLREIRGLVAANLALLLFLFDIRVAYGASKQNAVLQVTQGASRSVRWKASLGFLGPPGIAGISHELGELVLSRHYV